MRDGASDTHRAERPTSTSRGLLSAILVAAAALRAHLCASFGLFALAPLWATPVLVGGIAAVASGASWRRAAVGTGAGLVLGVAVARPWFLGQPIAGMHSTNLSAFLTAAIAGSLVAFLLFGNDGVEIAKGGVTG